MQGGQTPAGLPHIDSAGMPMKCRCNSPRLPYKELSEPCGRAPGGYPGGYIGPLRENETRPQRAPVGYIGPLRENETRPQRGERC
jgi:hypothetical protein